MKLELGKLREKNRSAARNDVRVFLRLANQRKYFFQKKLLVPRCNA